MLNERYFRVDVSYETEDFNKAIKLLELFKETGLKEQTFEIEARNRRSNE